jgi:glutamate-1-semialdehyde 2,1-aminomutase
MHWSTLYLLNRGDPDDPFHNMALRSPATTEADVDARTGAFREFAPELLS